MLGSERRHEWFLSFDDLITCTGFTHLRIFELLLLLNLVLMVLSIEVLFLKKILRNLRLGNRLARFIINRVIMVHLINRLLRQWRVLVKLLCIVVE